MKSNQNSGQLWLEFYEFISKRKAFEREEAEESETQQLSAQMTGIQHSTSNYKNVISESSNGRRHNNKL